ncbi:MAG: hypothetical protein M1484_02250 [Patescibacteria group bacterium]|nr:hypothetical protein [Patescibacteria group bacterium]
MFNLFITIAIAVGIGVYFGTHPEKLEETGQQLKLPGLLLLTIVSLVVVPLMILIAIFIVGSALLPQHGIQISGILLMIGLFLIWNWLKSKWFRSTWAAKMDNSRKRLGLQRKGLYLAIVMWGTAGIISVIVIIQQLLARSG